jgi:hypothetical protein
MIPAARRAARDFKIRQICYGDTPTDSIVICRGQARIEDERKHLATWGRLVETVSKYLGERKTSHDILSPGNKLPVYYPASLRDDKDLSPFGARWAFMTKANRPECSNHAAVTEALRARADS